MKIYTYIHICKTHLVFQGNLLHMTKSLCLINPQIVRWFLLTSEPGPTGVPACVSIRVGIRASPLKVKQCALLHWKFWWNKVILHGWIDLDDITTATTWKEIMLKINRIGWDGMGWDGMGWDAWMHACSPCLFPIAVVFCWNWWCLVNNPWEVFRRDTDIVIDDAMSVRNSCGPFLNLSVNGSKSRITFDTCTDPV